MLTDLIDLGGLLLLALALVVFVWPFTVAGALASGGLALLVLSWLIDFRKRGGKP